MDHKRKNNNNDSASQGQQKKPKPHEHKPKPTPQEHKPKPKPHKQKPEPEPQEPEPEPQEQEPEPQEPKAKKSRTGYQRSLPERLLAAYGIDYIKQLYADEVARGINVPYVVRVEDLPVKPTPNVICSLMDDPQIPLQEQIEVCVCLEKAKTAPKETYPVCKVSPPPCDHATTNPPMQVRLDTKAAIDKMRAAGIPEEDLRHTSSRQASVSIDLHRLCAWEQAGWAVDMEFDKYDAIHSCHNKRCFRHAYFGSKRLNQSTDFCEAWANMGGMYIARSCNHATKCLRPGASAFTFM